STPAGGLPSAPTVPGTTSRSSHKKPCGGRREHWPSGLRLRPRAWSEGRLSRGAKENGGTMQRQLLAALVLAADILPAQAQYWGYWGAPYPRGYGAPYPRGYYEDQRAYPRANPYWDGWGFGEEDRYRSPPMQSGGERPLIAPLAPAKIAFPSNFPVNS